MPLLDSLSSTTLVDDTARESARPSPAKVSLTQRMAAPRAPSEPAPVQRELDPAAAAIQRAQVERDTAAAFGFLGGPAASIDESLVQMKADAHTGLSDEAITAHAAAGVSGSGRALPHLDAIQRSFGPHDVSGVRAHVGGAAADASAAIGAHAYATGNDVAFAREPDLFLAAHEAAHVVQQRQGVHLSSAVGQDGDPYERHADAVADAVVRGESAADLLGHVAGRAAIQRSPVQRNGKKPDANPGASGKSTPPQTHRRSDPFEPLIAPGFPTLSVDRDAYREPQPSVPPPLSEGVIPLGGTAPGPSPLFDAKALQDAGYAWCLYGDESLSKYNNALDQWTPYLNEDETGFTLSKALGVAVGIDPTKMDLGSLIGYEVKHRDEMTAEVESSSSGSARQTRAAQTTSIKERIGAAANGLVAATEDMKAAASRVKAAAMQLEVDDIEDQITDAGKQRAKSVERREMYLKITSAVFKVAEMGLGAYSVAKGFSKDLMKESSEAVGGNAAHDSIGALGEFLVDVFSTADNEIAAFDDKIAALGDEKAAKTKAMHGDELQAAMSTLASARAAQRKALSELKAANADRERALLVAGTEIATGPGKSKHKEELGAILRALPVLEGILLRLGVSITNLYVSPPPNADVGEMVVEDLALKAARAYSVAIREAPRLARALEPLRLEGADYLKRFLAYASTLGMA